MPTKRLRGVAMGAGYFSRYQYEAWQRIPEVEITALYNRSKERGEAVREAYQIARVYDDWRRMLDEEKPDFVDIITPPETHLEMCSYAAERKIAIICQKPMAPTLQESQQLVDVVKREGVPFMVHENFRWQPWYREIKKILDAGTLGQVSHLSFRMRMGDGWPADAYLARQPFFRDYPRLLIYETGVHFIDTFRYLLGEIDTVYARLRRLNPAIKGEDAGQMFLTFETGATAIWDANRYNESEAKNPRYTFGDLRLDATKGHLTLDTAGEIRIKLLGQPSTTHPYAHEDRGFAGDCVYALQRHFADAMLQGRPFESHGDDYLRNVRAVEACYESAAHGLPVRASTAAVSR
ncbi:MAG: Gfo/Idh/MocA family oxidoreductase [Deltaproteobacteria bacterium]|nr:Gfo/Idh/MocA family oxidoreductase [Deltaproteobacteria bacterium]